MREKFSDVIDLNHEWVTKYRLPLVLSHNSQWAYPLALVMPEEEQSLYGPEYIVPTDAEAQLLSLYADFRVHRWFDEHYITTVIRKDILDIDPGVNTVTVSKSDKWGWAYRMDTWRHGAIPFFNDEFKCWKLIDLLELIENGRPGSRTYPNERWDKFQEDNAALIAETSA